MGELILYRLSSSYMASCRWLASNDPNSLPTRILYRTYTPLIHPLTPPWLKQQVTTSLSLFPLREGGVRECIDFVAGAVSNAETILNQGQSTSNPSITLDALKQASRLLSSVPASLTNDEYFSKLGPQLITLLDEGATEMQRAAAYIIGTGTLSTRANGAPGTPGWKHLVEPIVKPLEIRAVSTTAPGVIVTSESLFLALERLGAVTLLHPNPGLLRRLVKPHLLTLWGILCFSSKKTSLFTKSLQLLTEYLRSSAGSDGFIKILDNFMWDGGEFWTFARHKGTGVNIIRRAGSDGPLNGNELSLPMLIDKRKDLFIHILNNAADSAEMQTIFLHVLHEWLSKKTGPHSKKSSDDIFGKEFVSEFVYAILAQELMTRPDYRDRIISDPEKVIDFIRQLLEDFIKSHKIRRAAVSTLSKPSLSSLGSIINSPRTPHDNSTVSEEDAEVASICISLLTVILIDGNLPRTPTATKLLFKLEPSISSLCQSKSLPQSLRLGASAILNAISSMTNVKSSPTLPLANSNSLDQTTYTAALKDLASSEPPIRAEALFLLSKLIRSSSPTISPIPTAITIISLLQDPDSYVHLSAVRALSDLAFHCPSAVLDQLMKAYADEMEGASLDDRLRAGEALRGVVETLGETQRLNGSMAEKLAKMLLHLAGRRGHRPKTHNAEKKAETEHTSTHEPELETPEMDIDEEEEIDEEEAHFRRTAKIWTGWQGTRGEEDVRLRTSAVSLFSILLESIPSSCSPPSTILSTSLDISHQILHLECGEEKAILRRAAVMVFSSYLKVIEQIGVTQEWNLDSVEKELEDVERTDDDEIVRSHAGRILKDLNEVREEGFMKAMRGDGIRTELELDEGRLRGLDARLDNGTEVKRGMIKEVE